MAPLSGSTTQSGSAVLTVESTAIAKRNSRRVWLGRVLFPVCLCAAAAVLGVLAGHFLKQGEQELGETQFESIAERALFTAQGIMIRKRLGTVSMASIIANENSYADDWPFVTVKGYEEIATNLIATSSGRGMAFCPLVTPEQLSDFEDFAYDFYQNSRVPPLPNGTGVSSFGKGVWGTNPSLNTSDNRYHETDGSTPYASPNKIFAPVLQHNDGAHPVLMLNIHYQETRGVIIDDMIDCARERAATGNLSTECISITDMIYLADQDRSTGPAALILQPIYPASNATVMTGIVGSSIVWSEVLENIFTDEVSGIDCTLKTETRAYTFFVRNGVAYVRGEGEHFDRHYESYQRQISLTAPGLFSNRSATYTLSLYPSDEFFAVYSTNNPTLASVGAVMIILLTSLVFFLYDFFVRREFNAKRELLEAKRMFMRFVSHEVRTPLNSVCMGLTLMRDEMHTSLGIREKGWDAITAATTPSATDTVSSKKMLEMLHLAGEVFNNAQSSVNVLNDLLNYDKIEMGTLTLELSVIPIWKLIETTATEFKLPAAKKKIRFEIDFSPLYEKRQGESDMDARHLAQEVKEAKVIGDPMRITQVIRNLISNAVKFTPEEGALVVRAKWQTKKEKRQGSRTLVTETRSKNSHTEFTLGTENVVEYAVLGHVELSVTDTGAGMSTDQLSQLFGDGIQFNVNELQAGQGSGLGLYITKGIVEQHGGSLHAHSQGLGKGTTFTMTLPLHHVPDDDENADCESPTVSSSDSDICKGEVAEPAKPVSLRILIVDDALTNRKLLKRLLEKKGHRCELAQDGQEAVDRVVSAMKEDYPYDSILMDSEMPVMNGPAATTEIRRLGCDSFIVGITGNVLPEDVAHFNACGANEVLPKPFEMSDLEDMWFEYGVMGRVRDTKTR